MISPQPVQIALLGMFVVPIATTPSPAQQARVADSALIAQFRALETEWSNAIVAGDRQRLEQFLSPDYQLTVAIAGAPLAHVSRADWLEAATSTYKIHRYQYRELSARRVGQTVVVAAYYSQEATVNGRPLHGDFLLTDVWVEQGGRWRVAWRLSSQPESRGR
ncbi:MAG TPA: nuclear transport factor 2 family protein [Gemmatimonadaceae bacterium]|nr:nuclear transport factor 2 family protein [Gemmatimonadaceae bacterium]